MPHALQRLQKLLRARSFDLLALIPGPSLRYVTGLDFHLMERPVVLFVPAQGEPGMVLPELEHPRVQEALPAVQCFPYGEDEAARMDAFHAAAQRFQEARRVGVEPLRMRIFEHELIQETAPGWHFSPADEVITELRIRKSAEEVQHMARAVQIAETALTNMLPAIQPGMTERELAAELVVQLLRAGSEPSLPFEPIVASGPNSALPHATPTDRRLQPGDLLILDWGARSAGYISDLTRTFVLGRAADWQHIIHGLVESANAAGRSHVEPGVEAGAVDHAARTVIHAGGYGEAFIHRTGHGIGLEAHEQPNIRADERLVLESGMTFTIEPGIYLPGKGGVRIEDNVVVTEAGCRSLSSLPRDLVELS